MKSEPEVKTEDLEDDYRDYPPNVSALGQLTSCDNNQSAKMCAHLTRKKYKGTSKLIVGYLHLAGLKALQMSKINN